MAPELSHDVVSGANSESKLRTTTLLRRRIRAAAHRIVADCELLLDEASQPDWAHWREAVGEALLAGHQLRGALERTLHASGAVMSREEMAALQALTREPQRRVVQAMTNLLSRVPRDLDEELLLADARAIRDVAIRLGSDDTVLMPTIREPAPSDPALRRVERRASGSIEPGGSPRLLVVDDMPGPRKVLVRVLEHLGYDVIAAPGGLEALEIAGSQRIDLILSDIEMPECDGFALLERLKASDATRDIPVIVVSGLDDTPNVVRCIELGAEDHLAKPFDGVLLQARVRALLERKRLRDHELVYLSRVAQLTVAAEEVQSGTYTSGSLATLAHQDDELGRLARVFDRVVSGWQSREARLRRRLKQFGDEIRRSTARPSLELELLPGFGVLAPGELFAERYELVEELGRGGMGVVYRARDRELGEEVAIKVMRADLLKSDPGLIERLKMEIRLARRITHQNVVRSHDFGEWEGKHFLTMEYVRGITVERLLEAQGRLSVASTLTIGTQLAEALAVAHEQHIIHRDIKPANLLVDDAGILKVTDFGLARPLDNTPGLTQHGAVVGTPRYMPPEQLFGNTVDEKSDLFSAGAVLYECLTGLPPFDADTPTQIVAKLVDGPPAAIETLVPDVPPALAAVVARLVQYEPRDRVQSARELVDLLREIG
jgi:CheY-like chemotaxis protein/predicted Ser/Thr protein kinase